MDCPPHARDMYALMRISISPCVVTPNKPTAQAGRNHRKLTDQGLNDFFLIPDFACQTSKQNNAFKIGFQQQYRRPSTQVGGVSRTGQYGIVREFAKTEINQPCMISPRPMHIARIKVALMIASILTSPLSRFPLTELPGFGV